MPVKMEFIRLSSYGNDVRSTGKVKAIDLTLPNMKGKNVLIVEDIIDTGLTVSQVKRMLLLRGAKDVKIATL